MGQQGRKTFLATESGKPVSLEKKFQIEDRFRPLKRNEGSSEEEASSDLETRGNPREREGSWGDARARDSGLR